MNFMAILMTSEILDVLPVSYEVQVLNYIISDLMFV
jgi:hypothetical protein